MTEFKICNKCGCSLSVGCFYRNRAKKDGLGNYCKSCNAIHVKAYYEANKEKAYLKNKSKRDANRAFIYLYLQSNPCVDCGESDPVVLEFDHIKGEKYKSICELSRDNSIKSIQVEMDKCVVRCCNCHRRITSKRCNSYRYKHGQK